MVWYLQFSDVLSLCNWVFVTKFCAFLMDFQSYAVLTSSITAGRT